MTKANMRKELLMEADRLWRSADANIANMQPVASNPQALLMIEKNKGYKMAMEDLVEFIHNKLN